MTTPIISVTGRDFDVLVDLLRKLAFERGVDLAQNDFNISNFLQLFIDLFAGVGDGLNYMQDRQVTDLFWERVRSRENAIRLGKNIGFRLPAASASVTTLRFQISQISLNDVIIPLREQVQTNDPDNPRIFETVAQAVIPAGSIYVDVEAENALLQTEDILGTGVIDQRYSVERIPYVEGSVQVNVNGELWEAQEDFFNSKTTDTHYVVSLDSEDRMTVVFGDNENGIAPPVDATIDFQYKTGGGAAGEVFPNTVTVLGRTFVDQANNPVNISVSNITVGNGGSDKMSLARARKLGPRSIKTSRRTVAAEDFEINATSVAGVSRAKILTSDDNPQINENTGFLYIVPIGGGTASDTLRQQVLDNINNNFPTTVGFVLNVVSADFVPINFGMKVFLKDSTFREEARIAILAAFDEFFAETVQSGEEAGAPNLNMQFGLEFFNSVIEKIGQDAHPQVRNVELNVDIEDAFELNTTQFPSRGVIALENAETGEAL